MKENTIRIDPDTVKKRIKQFNEMEEIWKKSDDIVKAYLEGCIHTANVLALRDAQKAG